jgi:hypothetical protein
MRELHRPGRAALRAEPSRRIGIERGGAPIEEDLAGDMPTRGQSLPKEAGDLLRPSVLGLRLHQEKAQPSE